jgi:23S rRNA (guanosine2251-2'-O)-methyltransferase
METHLITIYGKHAVIEALAGRPDTVREVYLDEKGTFPEIKKLLSGATARLLPLTPKRLPKDVTSDTVHQGVAATIDGEKLMREYDAFMNSYEVTNDSAFILLGEVQDPQNVGSIIRTSAAFGVSGILIPEHRQAQITGAVVKVSAGMAFRMPLIRIGNVNQTVEDMKTKGFWTYALEGSATQSVYDEGFEKASVFVVGNEATGVREKTLEHCDIPLMIPMHAQAESLNAAVATAVVLSAWSKKHPGALS